MTPTIRRFLTLPRAERRLLAEAVAMLPLMSLALRTVGLRRCFLSLARVAPMSRGRPLGRTIARHRALRTAWLVRTAATHGPVRGNCLVRSLTIWWLLRRQGIPGELRIGVRKRHGRLEAHAWMEHQTRVLDDDSGGGGQFLPFCGARGILEHLGADTP